MCIFQTNKLEIYPEDTRIHLDYQMENEPDQHWRKRARQEKARRDDLNRIRNAWKMVEHTDSNVIVDIPGFDRIIAETLVEAVQLAIELEQQCAPPVQQEWLPSAAELDEIEENLKAGKEMAEDETRAIMAQQINGAYYL